MTYEAWHHEIPRDRLDKAVADIDLQLQRNASSFLFSQRLLCNMMPMQSSGSTCKYRPNVRRTLLTQQPGREFAQVDHHSIKQASEQIVVLNSSRCSGHRHAYPAAEHGSVLLVSEPSSSCSVSGQRHSHSNQKCLASLDIWSIPAHKAADLAHAAQGTDKKECTHTDHLAVIADASEIRLGSASDQAGTDPSIPVCDFHATSEASDHQAHRAVTADASENAPAGARTQTGRRASSNKPDLGSLSSALNSKMHQPEKTLTSTRTRAGRHLYMPIPGSSTDNAVLTPCVPQAVVVDGLDETSQLVKRRATRCISGLTPCSSAIPQAGRRKFMTIETSTPTTSRARSSVSMTREASTSVEPRACRHASRTVERWMSSKARSGRNNSAVMPGVAPATGENNSEEASGICKRQAGKGATAPLSKSTLAGAETPRRHTGRQVTIKDELISYSLDLGIPMGLVSQAYDVFIDMVKLPCGGNCNALVEGKLIRDRFSQILCNLADVDEPDKLPKDLLRDAFEMADQDGDNEIDFKEFVVWYSKHGFSESISCSREQRELRELANKLGMTVPDIENFKSSFDRFDEDGSGAIDIHEFEDVLRVLMRIPRHVQIPTSRVRHFWREVDTDQNGEINFDEFLNFFLRRFGDEAMPPTASEYSAFKHTSVRKPCTS